MLIPATFNAPEGTTVTVIGTADLSSTYESELNVPSTNIYSTEVFTSLEKLGVVALPCSGARNGTIVFYVNEYGDYWSASAYDSSNAYMFSFRSSYVASGDINYRIYGRPVRLVQDIPFILFY